MVLSMQVMGMQDEERKVLKPNADIGKVFGLNGFMVVASNNYAGCSLALW